MRLILCGAAAITLAGCGYHVSGHADLLPKNIKTIAVPAFANVTIRYRLADRLATDITREFIERTRYHVVADPAQADAVLQGAVISFVALPTTIDPASSRASGVQVIVLLQLVLTDNTGKVILNRPGMEVRGRYEISADPKAYLDESGPAAERVARDVARTVVSAVLENF